MKILLLNPPGERLYQRDYYCSKVSKAAYLFHPTDLLILSGILATRHSVEVLDALAEGLKPEDALQRIARIDPQVVISLCGAVSWPEDSSFFVKLKAWNQDLRLMVSGDLVLEGAKSFPDDAGAVDALLLDFTSDSALRWIEGGEGEEISQVFYRRDGGWVGRALASEKAQNFTIPVPRHDLFPADRYRFPLLRRRRFATLLTDYGCRYKCRFCVTGQLGYKCRPVANVLEELAVLAESGYRELYLNDQTFATDRQRAVELLMAMIEGEYRFGWACWSRVDLVDADLLDLMRRAGCHTIMFGAETDDAATLAAWRKGVTPQQVSAAMQICRQAGIRTLATFMLGLPGQDAAACRQTVEFACRCGCDFASFNVPVPRLGTDLRRQALHEKWIDSGDLVFDQSGIVAAMGNGLLSAREIMDLRHHAVRRFYLRPGYLFSRLAALRRPGELFDLVRFGLATLQ